MSTQDQDQDYPNYVFSRAHFPDAAQLAEDVYVVAPARLDRLDLTHALYMTEADARSIMLQIQWVIDGPAEKS